MDHEALSALLSEAVRRHASDGANLSCRSAEIDSGGVPVTTVTVPLSEEEGDIRVLLGRLHAALQHETGSDYPVNLELFTRQRSVAFSGRVEGRNFSLVLEL